MRFGAYVINLDRNADRLNTFATAYEETRRRSEVPPAARFPAVDGSRMKLPVHPAAEADLADLAATGARRRHEQLTPGAVGCYYSHLACWKVAESQGVEVALVFEDDAAPPPELDVRGIVRGSPADWDIILLGYDDHGSAPVAGDLRSVTAFTRTHAYLVRPRRALARAREGGWDLPREQLDWAISRAAREPGGVRVYGTRPDLVGAPWAGTDIQTPLSM